jgi:hypothetical protein
MTAHCQPCVLDVNAIPVPRPSEGIGIALRESSSAREAFPVSETTPAAQSICTDVLDHKMEILSIFALIPQYSTSKELQDADILLLKPIVIVCRSLAAVDNRRMGLSRNV